MIKLHSFWIFFLVLNGFVNAQNAVRPFPMEERALLWEIEGENIKKSYVFGTVHLIEKASFFYPKKLQKVLKNSELLVLEMIESPGKEMLEWVTLKEGSFFDFFSDAQADSIFHWASEKKGISEEVFRATFSRMKPFVVSLILSEMGSSEQKESYEIRIAETADRVEIPKKGLETLAEQMAVLDAFSAEDQAEMVMKEIRNQDDVENAQKQMLELYRNQDIDGLYQLTISEIESDAKKRKVLLDDRNIRWIGEIESLIKSKKTFIAVGAGHLGGPNGVIRLLEKQGYTLKPVKL